MSHTPLEGDDLTEALDPESQYRQHWDEMSDRLRKGGSLSGRERNCAFLNLNGSQFATISALSGFDFPDDSRALALVDWNADGNMDVWLSNRTAPRIRFLQNTLKTSGKWIQFALASPAQIDPIGARVQITLDDGRTLLRSLRAGEGFLGQSSRILHFGLGEATITGIIVRWPDGSIQKLPPVETETRYLITPDQQIPKKISPKTQPVFAPSSIPASREAPSPWIRSAIAIPFPPLIKYDPLGKPAFVHSPQNGPILINLWDPECADCKTELLEWKAHRETLPKDLQIVTLLTNPRIDLKTAKAFIEENKLPFDWGVLHPESTKTLAELLRKIYQTRDQFAAPASFLIDQKGELLSFSIGKVTAAQIASEKEEITQPGRTPHERLAWALGKSGVWIDPADKVDLLFIPRALLRQNQLDAAASYVRQAYFHLAVHRDIDRFLIWIGDSYFKKGNTTEGLKFYLNALKNGTTDPIVMNNVAWQFATHPDPKVRNAKLAIKWAEEAVRITEGKQATYYDTLAAAYAEAGSFQKALAKVNTGLKLATDSKQQALIAGFLKAKQLYSRQLPYRQE